MISALLVKELREKSGAGMMDAKKALLETDGDLEAAQDWLRTKGLLKAEKKSSRVAAEGLVGVRVQGDTGMIVELNSETDFVATNKEFIELVDLVLSEGFGITDKDDILKKNPDELIILPLFPHYAAATTGSVYEEVSRILSKRWVVPKIKFINQFYDNDKFIDAWIDKASKFQIDTYDKIIFSYHGIPNSHVDNVYPDSMCADHNCEMEVTQVNKFCYKATTYETTKILAKKLNIPEDKYIVTYQSRLTNKWLSPFTDEVLESLPKDDKKNVLVFSPAFTADCLETIIEIGDEYKELFEESGGENLDYVESLNYSDLWADAIIDIIK